MACALMGGTPAAPPVGSASALVTPAAQSRRSSLELEDVADLKRTLAPRPWGDAQYAAHARFAEGLTALREADQETWDGPEGEVYAALADVQLWLFANDVVPKRADVAYRCGIEALERIERAHGHSAPFLELLVSCGRFAAGRGRIDEALALLTDERVRRGMAAGCIEAAWAYVVQIDCDLDRGRYGAARDRLDEALEYVAGGASPEHLYVTAQLHAQIVQLETERGRIDWARAALAIQRAAIKKGAALSDATSADPIQATRASWRARQLLLSELRIDNARQDAPSALVRSTRVFDAENGRWRGDPPDDLLGWTLRLQVTRAMLTADPTLGLSLASGIAEAENAGAVDRAFCWLLRAHADIERGSFDSAVTALDRAAHVLQQGSIGVEHVIHARLTAERARAARARAERAAPRPDEPTLDLAADLDRLCNALDDFRIAWRAAGDEPDGIGFLQFDYRRELLVEVHRLARAALGEERAAALLVEELAATQALGGLTRSLTSTPFDMKAATALLRARGEGLVMLFPGRSELLLVALDGDGPFVRELGVPADALAPLQRLAALLRRPDFVHDRWREPAREGGARLFPGKLRARVMRWSRWSFVQPELVGSLPLELLDIEGIGVLALERPTAVLPTLPAWLALERRAAEPRRGAGLVALVEPLPDRARLAELGMRVDLGGTTPAACAEPSAVTLSGANATLAAVARAARAADVLVLWSHGHEAQRPGEGVGFEVTAPDGTGGTCARARDIERAFTEVTAPALVVLGICGALQPGARPGEDASGHLGGTFLGLGADVVLASVRDVHAMSARILVDTFLAHRAAGESDSEALLAARRVVAGHERFAHPHYWATLSAVGVAHRARHPELEPGTSEGQR